MRKATLYIIVLCFIYSCKKTEYDNSLDVFAGEYVGARVVITHCKEYDSIFNQYVSVGKYDSIGCSLNLIVNDGQLDIKEYDSNNQLIKYWHGWEINNIGELAYLHPDTTGYGNIKSDTLSLHLTFPHTTPPDNIIETTDTLFYGYYYTAYKNH